MDGNDSMTVVALHGQILNAQPLLGTIFFIFMPFLETFGQIIHLPPLLGLAPLWEILDLLLHGINVNKHSIKQN